VADPAERIAFGRFDLGADFSQPPAMWTANSDGSDEQPVGDQRGWYIEWSPDRTHLIFDFTDANGDAQIATVRLDGSGFTQLTEGPGFNGDPAYSPDGTVIAYSHSAVAEDHPDFRLEIWVMDADGSSPRRLVESGGVGHDWEPVFSPDGTQIVFTREADSDGTNSAVHVANADGTDVRALTEFADYVEHPRWSPDGTTIIYNIETQSSAVDTAVNGIWTVPAAGGESVLLLESESHRHPFKPSYSPDGTRILFGCAVRGAPLEDLCVMNADGSDIRAIITTREVENHGVWS